MTHVDSMARTRGFTHLLRRCGDKVARVADKGLLPVLAVLTAFYAAVVCVMSSLKLLWLDELITLFLVRLGSVSAIVRALHAGADPNPPLSYLCVLLSRAVFGEGALALRLPAAVGYWIGLASLLVYLRRRLPPVWALSGTFLSMAMAAFDYSYEGRSYGLLYGMAMLSFLCWSVAVDPSTSKRWRITCTGGMALAVALGVCTNYFAVLSVVPIAAGELARISEIDRRVRGTARWFPSVWAGLLVGCVPLLFLRSMIARAVLLYAPFAWNRVTWKGLLEGYTENVEAALWPLLLVMMLALWLLFTARNSRSFRNAARSAFAARFAQGEGFLPAHEAVAVAVLMVYPVLGYVMASLHGGMLSARFVIPVCLGFAIAGVAVLCRLSAAGRRQGAALLCLCVAWLCAREAYVGYTYKQQRASFAHLQASATVAVLQEPDNASVAVPDPLLAVTLEHYAPAALRERIAFPLDFSAIRRFRHDDSPEENLWAGRDLLPGLHIVPLADFQRQNGTYLILAAEKNWLLQELTEQHHAFTRLPADMAAPYIGGFTPLAHGAPVLFRARGDAVATFVAGPASPLYIAEAQETARTAPVKPNVSGKHVSP